MALFKKVRGGAKGGPWIARYRDGNGIVRERSTGCLDKTAAQSVLTEWQREAERQRAGLLTAQEAAAAQWANEPLAKHIDGYQEHLRAAGATERHIDYRKRELDRVFKDCGWHRLSDLNRDGFSRWLNARAKEGMGARRRNVHFDAVCGFARWALDSGRITLFPFNGLAKSSEAIDRRHVRRALSPEELAKLLEAAESRPVNELLEYPNVTPSALQRARRVGRERALFYRLLAFSGLRANEARTLRLGDLSLEGKHPHINLRAATEKNRKGASVPLRADLVVALKSLIEDRRNALGVDSIKRGAFSGAPLGLDTPLFEHAPSSVKVFDKDLVAAGLATLDKKTKKITKTDDRGRTLDIHSLRGTFASMLAASGVPLATAQVLMRHSTPTLTARHYVDPRMLDTEGAVNALPVPLYPGALESIPAVMHGGRIEPQKRPLQRPLPADKTCPKESLQVSFRAMGDTTTKAQEIAQSPNKTTILGEIRKNKMARQPRIERGAYGLEGRCSIQLSYWRADPLGEGNGES